MQAGKWLKLGINEVATRDGFQMEGRFIETDDKVTLVDELSSLGYAKIEVTSFTSAQAIPALRDAEVVMQRTRRAPGVIYTALVPNLRGAESAIAGGADLIIVPLSASHAHSLANLRKTPDEVVADIARMRAERDASGARTRIEVGMSTAFGCTIQGAVDPAGFGAS